MKKKIVPHTHIVNKKIDLPILCFNSSILDTKVEPLCVSIGVHVGSQVELIVVLCDLNHSRQIARFEP